MNEKRFQLGSSPRLSFHACVGDLRIQSWQQEDVQVLFRHEGEAASAQQAEGELRIANAMPEAVNVPAATTVLLQSCAGDVHVTGCAVLRVEQHQGDLVVQQVNEVELKQVHGDVQAGEAQSLSVTTLHGDLRARAIAQSLDIALVHGDIALTEAKGQLTLQDITGDVVIRDPAGHLDVRNVTGDVLLSGTPQTGDYHLEALGDVTLRLGTDSDVSLELEARLGRITSCLALTEVAESTTKLSGKLGQGVARLRVLTHNGDIRVHPLSSDQIRLDMEKDRIWVEVHARRAAERAQRAAERRTIWAEAHARRTAEHAERMAEKARRVQERLAQKAEERAGRMRRFQIKWGTPQPAMSAEALENERLAILKMLAEGKINAEQAESLLDALEG